jgi:hypothetical protein
VHKAANVIAELQKSQQPKAKRGLQEIWMAETKAAAKLATPSVEELAADALYPSALLQHCAASLTQSPKFRKVLQRFARRKLSWQSNCR